KPAPTAAYRFCGFRKIARACRRRLQPVACAIAQGICRPLQFIVCRFDFCHRLLEIDPERPFSENSTSETKGLQLRNPPKPGFPDRSLGAKKGFLVNRSTVD